MKGIVLVPLVFLLSACGCWNNTCGPEYREVIVAPVVTTVPTYYSPVGVITNGYSNTIDVTTTTVDYY